VPTRKKLDQLGAAHVSVCRDGTTHASTLIAARVEGFLNYG
jgi:hypothetical protein